MIVLIDDTAEVFPPNPPNKDFPSFPGEKNIVVINGIN